MEHTLTDLLGSPFVLAQNEVLGKLWSNTAAEPSTILTILIVLMVLISAIIFASYRYQRWKRFKEFEEEMKSLDLEPEDEGTFAWMVKRYKMDEPVNIIYSPRLFDEMATNEMLRVLASQASMESKRDFIDTVYTIRTKTYHPDWLSITDKASYEE